MANTATSTTENDNIIRIIGISILTIILIALFIYSQYGSKPQRYPLTKYLQNGIIVSAIGSVDISSVDAEGRLFTITPLPTVRVPYIFHHNGGDTRGGYSERIEPHKDGVSWIRRPHPDPKYKTIFASFQLLQGSSPVRFEIRLNEAPSR